MTSGTRHLFVMSFNLVRKRPGAFEPPPPPPPPPEDVDEDKPEVVEDTDVADSLADFADMFGSDSD